MGAGAEHHGSGKHKWGKLEVEDKGEAELLLGSDDGGHGPSGGSVWGSVFNLCNSAIGAGILALPYAIKQSGVVLGMICMVLMCLVLAFTLKILVWTNRLHPIAKSYEKLVWVLYGKKASILVTLSVILTTFGACTGFLVIIGDLLPPIVKLIFPEPDWISDRVPVALVVSLLGVLPLASLKNFNSLRFSSTMAIVSVTFTVFVVIFRSAGTFPLTEAVKNEIKLFNLGGNVPMIGIFEALPLIGFAFGCHMQVIPIFGELKDNHIPSKINWVIVCTNAVCLILYSLTGVFGYLEFPTSKVGNVLNNYPNDDALVNVARAVLCFVIVCHYPPSNYCCRGALEYLCFPNSKPSTVRRLAWTAVIWGLAFLFSVLVPHIDVVFGLIGATANSLIVFIFPAIFLFQLSSRYNWEGFDGLPAKITGAIIFSIGAIICVAGTLVIVLSNWFPKVLGGDSSESA